ncbi:MAG: ABC transporter substrate-binding protein [Dehalococcoidales bacterium]|nr:ABC transporter substrate-binding protein [Dehalococcoidales bacterium]
MKKRVFGLLTILLVLVLLLGACGQKTTTTGTTTTSPYTTATTTGPTTSKTTTTAATTTTTVQSKYGGTLKIAFSMYPLDLGYPPEYTVTQYRPFYLEPLMWLDPQNKLVPALATAVKTDLQTNSITWTLRQGVKFHDGSDWNAQAAYDNFELMKDAGMLPDQDKVVSLEVVDNSTFRVILTQLSYPIIQSFSTKIYMVNVDAIKENGKEWAYTNCYGTGPFVLADTQRDNYIRFTRNNDYWREGLPYLDEIYFRILIDTNTTTAALEKKEVDYNMNPRDLYNLEMFRSWGADALVENVSPVVYFMAPDSIHPSSPLANKMVREACEYALDRKGLEVGFFQGLQTALYTMAPPGTVGYDPNYPIREYNIAKAKQLLSDAGYPDGIDITIYGLVFDQQLYATIQGMWAEAGIRADIVIYDIGKFLVTQAQGWENGFLFSNIPNKGMPSTVPTFLDTFGPMPVIKPHGAMARSDAYTSLCNEYRTAIDVAASNAIFAQMIKQLSDDAQCIPVSYNLPRSVVYNYVHFDEALDRGVVDPALIWISK